MNNMAYAKWPAGRGRGQSSHPNLEFYEDRPGRNPGISLVRRDPVSNNYKLHVRSIPSGWNEDIFEKVFRKCGEPLNLYLHPNKGPLTWGFVEYQDYHEACNAVTELNNNIVLGIQVMFAREKPAEIEDPILRFLASQSEDDGMDVQSLKGPVEPLVDPRTIVKTVKNDSNYGSTIPIEEFHKVVLDAENQKFVEEALFQKILAIYKEGENSTAKCNVCEMKCSLACSGCTTVFYCSEDCQNKDWAAHSRNCKGSSIGTTADNGIQSRGGGDHRQSNGFGSFDTKRENKFDNQNNRFANDRGNFRDNNRNNDRGFNREDRNASDQPGKRSLVDERRARMALNTRQNESDRGFQNRSSQNYQRSNSSQETRNSFKSRTETEQADDGDWDSPSTKEIKIKQEVPETIAVIKEEIKSENPKAVAEPVQANEVVNAGVQEQVLQPQSELKVVIYHVEDRGLYWVQKPNQETKINALFKKLEEYLTAGRAQFSPVQDGICGIQYEGKWYRCQIASLDPLSVIYIDFGYPEIVNRDRLFELSSELTTLPPFAFKIKLVDGTTTSFLNKSEGDTLDLILIEKVSNYWLAQVMSDMLVAADISKAISTNSPIPSGTTVSPVPVSAPAAPETVPDVLATVPAVPATVPVVPVIATTTPVSAPAPSATVPTVTVTAPAAPVTAPAAPVTTPAAPVTAPAAPITAEKPLLSPQKPYPHMLDATRFTTVSITYFGGSDEKDDYYIGAPTIWNTLCEMSSYFKSVIGQCEELTPELGKKGLAEYQGFWYRVEVLSVTPVIRVRYIDFGNVETIEPKGLKKCPDSHKDIPDLVHKIKLAPGTSQKYFNLPDESNISVKPVSLLLDGTVVVEVEGENYVQGTTAQSPETPSVAPTLQHTANTGPTIVPVPTTPNCAVDLLQENWKISFVPSEVDYVKNSLLGQVYCEHIPAIFTFFVENEKFQNYLSSQQFDSNFKANVGEIVGLRLRSGSWERGRVLSQEGLVAFIDNSGVTRCSELFKLPESFTNIPSMAAVLTLSNEDPDLLSRLVNEDEIIFDVVKVTTNKGHTTVNICNNNSIVGELRTWDYEPLETADPLAQGEPVTISKVLDSNTLLVSPANDLEVQQAIQIDCRKTSEDFENPPKEGDYVSFLDKESDGYFRSRVHKVDGDAYTIYAVDNATYHQAKLSDLRPLPKSLRNVPCRISQISLKDVDKVLLTEQAQMYLCHIVEEDKLLTLVTDDSGKVTLTVEGEDDTLNSILMKLLKPQVVPNSDGKLTILSLPELGIPLNQEFNFVITHTEPMYVQLAHVMSEHPQLYDQLQEQGNRDNALYNPCQGELCIAKFLGEWYRCRCLRETNTGTSVLMLVDYGNIFEAPTSDIRRILPEMLQIPSLAVSCKIHDLPDQISPALKTRLDEILKVDQVLSGVFVAEKNCCYEVVIETVSQCIKELQ